MQIYFPDGGTLCERDFLPSIYENTPLGAMILEQDIHSEKDRTYFVELSSPLSRKIVIQVFLQFVTMTT